MAALQAFLAHKKYEIGKPLNDPSLHSEVEHFAKWVLDIRNGNIEGIETSDGSDTICIPIPQDLLIEQSLGLDGLINAIYASIPILEIFHICRKEQSWHQQMNKYRL